MLGKHGFGAVAESHEMLSKSRIAELALDDARLVCLSCLDGSSAAYLRFVLRRLHRRSARVPVLVGAWWRQTARQRSADDGDRRDDAQGRDTVSTLADALVYGARLASEDAAAETFTKPGAASAIGVQAPDAA